MRESVLEEHADVPRCGLVASSRRGTSGGVVERRFGRTWLVIGRAARIPRLADTAREPHVAPGATHGDREVVKVETAVEQTARLAKSDGVPPTLYGFVI
jgi:hypothetical protein